MDRVASWLPTRTQSTAGKSKPRAAMSVANMTDAGFFNCAITTRSVAVTSPGGSQCCGNTELRNMRDDKRQQGRSLRTTANPQRFRHQTYKVVVHEDALRLFDSTVEGAQRHTRSHATKHLIQVLRLLAAGHEHDGLSRGEGAMSSAN